MSLFVPLTRIAEPLKRPSFRLGRGGLTTALRAFTHHAGAYLSVRHATVLRPGPYNKSERSLSAGIQPLYDRLRFVAPVTYGLRLLSLSAQACCAPTSTELRISSVPAAVTSSRERLSVHLSSWRFARPRLRAVAAGIHQPLSTLMRRSSGDTLPASTAHQTCCHS